MPELHAKSVVVQAELEVHVGIPTHLRADEGDDSWVVLGPNKTPPDVAPNLAEVQVRRIGFITPDGKVWQDQPGPSAVPIFVPLEERP